MIVTENLNLLVGTLYELWFKNYSNNMKIQMKKFIAGNELTKYF